MANVKSLHGIISPVVIVNTLLPSRHPAPSLRVQLQSPLGFRKGSGIVYTLLDVVCQGDITPFFPLNPE